MSLSFTIFKKIEGSDIKVQTAVVTSEMMHPVVYGFLLSLCELPEEKLYAEKVTTLEVKITRLNKSKRMQEP